MPELAPSPMVWKKPEEPIGLIQGQAPDSVNEWYVSLALEKLKIEYMYQFSIYGGRGQRGGQVIDFLCFTAIGSIPVYVQGAYWHSWRNDPDLILRIAEARHYFKTEPVLLDEEETSSRETALVAVRRKVQV